MTDKIQPTHLERRAAVYLRQSTLKQVLEHRESTARQYALQQRAVEIGWAHDRIDVIDDDLGRSGSSVQGRTGFQRLAEEVAHGRIGAIFALEVSRLARSSADWHKLLDLCGLADVVIADEQAVYTPRDYNDRLLLGLKGTMSEAEQYWMRLRLQGGKLNKARRGALYFAPPIGYEWDGATCRFRLDPDEQVQRAVRLVFERFRLDGSAYAVTRYFASQGLKIPAHDRVTRELRWGPPRHNVVLSLLHNPTYAGAYTFGRREARTSLVDGQLRRRRARIPLQALKICLRDHHPAYIGWEEHMANQRKLHENRTSQLSPEQRGAAREGHALLQGIALCGKCGHRMSVHYWGPQRQAQYACHSAAKHTGVKSSCWSVSARVIDEAVAKLFLEAVQPPEVELGLAVVREAERQAGEVGRQWKLRLDRAHYEARLAERRYKAVDPDNRVVARTLEREWNDKLRAIEELEREHQEVCRREKVELTDADRSRILHLAKDLSRVWHAETTTHAERKNLLRMLVREVTLSPIDVPERKTRVQLLWQTGAVNDFTVLRRGRSTATPTVPETVELIRQLVAAKKRDVEISAELNRRGLRTGLNRPWAVTSVAWVRSHHGMRRPHGPPSLRVPDRRNDGLYSIHGVATRFGVAEHTVYYWVDKGWLKGSTERGWGRARWFRLDHETVKQLKAAKARGYGPGARKRQAHSETPGGEEGHCA